MSNQSIEEQKNIPKNILLIETRTATNDYFDRQLIYQIRKQLIYWSIYESNNYSEAPI